MTDEQVAIPCPHCGAETYDRVGLHPTKGPVCFSCEGYVGPKRLEGHAAHWQERWQAVERRMKQGQA